MRYLNGRTPACYCAPMICALAPFPTCSHRTPGRLVASFAVEHLTVCELRHTTTAANRVEFSFPPHLRPAANGRPSFAIHSVTQRRGRRSGARDPNSGSEEAEMSKATGPLCNQLRISQYYSAGAVFVSVRIPPGAGVEPAAIATTMAAMNKSLARSNKTASGRSRTKELLPRCKCVGNAAQSDIRPVRRCAFPGRAPEKPARILSSLADQSALGNKSALGNFRALVRKPMPPGQHIRPVRLCAFGRDRKASGDFHEPLDLQR